MSSPSHSARAWSARVSALGLAGAVALGCERAPAATEVLVVVDTDLAVGSELTRVEAKVVDVSGASEVLGSAEFALTATPGARGYTLPLSFSVAPQSAGSTRRFRLEVSGYGRLRASDPEARVIERQMVGAFRPHRSLRADVFLGRVCLGVVCSERAGEPLTCGDDGQCGRVPAISDPAPFPSLDGAIDTALAGEDARVPFAGLDDAGGLAGEDAGTVDGAALDASTTPEDTGPPPSSDAGNGADASVPDAGCSPASSSCCPTGTVATSQGCVADIDECADPANTCPADWPCAQTLPAGYTCTGELADWPIPDAAGVRGHAPSYAVLNVPAPGLVRDQVTGLLWERTTSAAVTMTYAAAVERCKALSVGGYGGFRQPSRGVLLSVHDVSHAAPNIDQSAFPGSSVPLLWTRAPQSTGFRWGVYFGDGVAGGYGESGSLSVRCVHGDPIAPGTPATHYSVDLQGDRITDLRTGLVWQRTVDTVPRSYADAVAACKKLGMTLPTLKELFSLVDAARKNPALAPVFPAMGRTAMWSSTAQPGSKVGVFAVSFEEGSYFPAATTAADPNSLPTYAYRCVR